MDERWNRDDIERLLVDAFRPGGLICQWVHTDVDPRMDKLIRRNCGRLYQTGALLLKHVRVAHCQPAPASDSKQHGTASRPAKRFRCCWPRCPGAKFATPDELYEHVRDAHISRLLYRLCPYEECPAQPSSLIRAVAHLREHLQSGWPEPTPHLIPLSFLSPPPSLPTHPVPLWDLEVHVRLPQRTFQQPLALVNQPLAAVDSEPDTAEDNSASDETGCQAHPASDNPNQPMLVRPHPARPGPSHLQLGLPQRPPTPSLQAQPVLPVRFFQPQVGWDARSAASNDNPPGSSAQPGSPGSAGSAGSSGLPAAHPSRDKGKGKESAPTDGPVRPTDSNRRPRLPGERERERQQYWPGPSGLGSDVRPGTSS